MQRSKIIYETNLATYSMFSTIKKCFTLYDEGTWFYLHAEHKHNLKDGLQHKNLLRMAIYVKDNDQARL